MKKKTFIKGVMVIIFAGVLGAWLPVFALVTDNSLDYKEERFDYTRVFYYRDGTNARESLFANYESIDIFAPQSYAFDGGADLKGSVPEEVLDFVKEKDIKIMPLVTNGSFGQESLKTILGDTKKQKQAIKQMVTEAKKRDYIGWQIDFEQMNVAYKDKFSLFVERIGKEFHKNGLVLSVAVIAKISDTPSDYKNTLWVDLIGVYDYKRISDASDFVSIMSYDAPDSKGAIAPYPWLLKVLDYSLKFIPSQKLSLGIPLYYWKWDDVRGKITGMGGFEGLRIALGTYNPKLGYSSKDQAPYLKYTRNKVSNTIWYENEISIKSKIDLISEHRLHGFSAWALGLELPAVHIVMEK